MHTHHSALSPQVHNTPTVPDFDALEAEFRERAALLDEEVGDRPSTLTLALKYAAAGFPLVPTDPRQPKNPGSIVGAKWPSRSTTDREQIVAWFQGHNDRGIYLHCGAAGIVVFDVDTDDRDDVPEVLLRHAVDNQAVPWHTTRVNAAIRGHYLFRVPEGRRLGNGRGELTGRWGDVRAGNAGIAVYPTEHPADDGLYRWHRGGPVPLLPDALGDLLPVAADAEAAVTDVEVGAFLATFTTSNRPELVDRWVSVYTAEVVEKGRSRHDSAVSALTGAFVEARLGAVAAAAVHDALRDVFVKAVTTDMQGRRTRSVESARTEFAGIARWAVGQALQADLTDAQRRLDEKMPELTLPAPEEYLLDPATPNTEPTIDEVMPADTDDEVYDDLLSVTTADSTDVDPDKLIRSLERLTHDGIALQLLPVFRREFAWSKGRGWMRYNRSTGTWQEVDTRGNEASAAVAALMRDMFERLTRWAVAARNTGTLDNDALGKFTGSLKMLRSRQTARLVTESLLGLVLVRDDVFDQNPLWVNTRSGVFDIASGELLPHSPGLYLTKCAAGEYRPDWQDDPKLVAAMQDWYIALGALPADCEKWFRIRMGQAITGYTPSDDVLLLFTGGGENGKSTILTGVEYAAGDYAATIPHKVFTARSGDHSTELTTLQGVRIAKLEETAQAARLDPASIKRVVGTPTITARRINRDNMTWKASHTLFIASNHVPQVSETDHGTWRRLLRVPFPYKFVKPPQQPVEENERIGDPGLRPRIERRSEHHTAILTWLCEAAREWYVAHGEDETMPEVPRSVQAAVDEWRSEADRVGEFFTDTLVPAPGRWVATTDLYTAWSAWCKEHGYEAGSDNSFGRRFRECGPVQELGSALTPPSNSTRIHPDAKNRSRTVPTTAFTPSAPPNARVSRWIGVAFASDTTVPDRTDQKE